MIELTDKDIFNDIFSRNVGQPIEIVMQEYEKAKMLNDEIERRLGIQNCNLCPVEQTEQEIPFPVEMPVPVQPQKKKYPRHLLTVKPEDAIGEYFIKCCICGQEGHVITVAHLKKHDITVDRYKKLCRYPKEQTQMSKKSELFTKNLVKRAQNARKAKIAGLKDDM